MNNARITKVYDFLLDIYVSGEVSMKTMLQKHKIGTYCYVAANKLGYLEQTGLGKWRWNNASEPTLAIAKMVAKKQTELNRPHDKKKRSSGAAMVRIFDSLQLKDIPDDLIIAELKSRGYRIQRIITEYVTL